MSEKVVVVGAGFGGLAAAIRLRARGYEVTVVEATDQAGGRGRTFLRDGFSFDAGPTVITAPYLIEELFEAAGRRMEDHLELVPVDPFYRVSFPDGGSFDYVGDEERLISQIRDMSPADVDGYRRLAKQAKEIFETGYLKLADAPFNRLSDMLRVVPDMIRLGSYRTVYGMVSKFIKDERLRQVFTFQPLLVGGNPFNTPSIYLLIHWLERKWGVHFAKGGTAAIVKSLVDLLEEIDVELRLNASVSEIEVANGKVCGLRLTTGEQIAADRVVFNGDPSTAYTKLVAARHRRKHTDAAVGRKRQSMSLFVGYFGTDKTYPDLAHHTIVLGPRYRELLEDIFERKVLSDDFSLYLHAPTRTDPSLAPKGHENFYVLSPVPNQLSGIDWQKRAAPYFEAILESLEERLLPNVRDHIVTRHHVDPRYFENTLQSHQGAAFGPEPRLTQSAYFRYHNVSEDIEGLFFVGAGTHPGAGLPGVLCSAKVLDKVMPDPIVPLELPKVPAARRTAPTIRVA